MKNVIEKYTYAGIVDEAINRENISGHNEARENDFNFTQTKSFEEAVDFAKHGWDLGLKKYQIKDGLLVGGSTELSPSVAGCIPHVQNHILGYPQDMYALYDSREYNLPTLDLIVNLTYSGYNDSDNALKFGKSLVAFINAKAETRNIRLTGVFASNQINCKAYQFITLKDFDSALVLNNVAFAFHPSFFRRIWFSILEGKKYWDYGYGSPIDDYRDVADEYLEGGKSDEKIYFKMLNNISKYEWGIDDLDKVTF